MCYSKNISVIKIYLGWIFVFEFIFPSKKFIKNLLGDVAKLEVGDAADLFSSKFKKKTKFIWLGFRTKFEEIMELVLFFGGVTLVILILCGILPFGVLGIGIGIALSLIGMSRFLLTNSWTTYHNLQYARSELVSFIKTENMGNKIQKAKGCELYV